MIKKLSSIRLVSTASAVGFFIAGLCTPLLASAEPDDQAGQSFTLLKTIPIPTSLKPLYGFDISWFDADTRRYYLADRSNASIDVIDAATGTFLTAIKGGFAGAQFNAAGASNNNISGPNGVTTSGRWLFATDGGSHVVSVDLASNAVVSSVITSTSVNRADELAYDPVGHTLLVVNNADSPPFATLIKVDPSTGHLAVKARVTFDAAHGVDATNGAEQPIWDAATGYFYLSIPQIGPNARDGGVARVSPTTGQVTAVFPIQFCQPAGLTLGAKQTALLGCGGIFDAAGNVWTSASATTAAPISVLLNLKNGTTEMVEGITGSDEVWYNKGDDRFYLAARGSTVGPVIGVVDAKSASLVELIPTINVAGKANLYPSGTSHSVAVDSRKNQVYVPLPANNVFPNCLNGCVGVFGARKEMSVN